MLNNLNLTLGFDYLLCMDHNVVVEVEKRKEHEANSINVSQTDVSEDIKPCEFVGQFFKTKQRAKKLSNDISKKLVDGIKEKENEKAWEKRYDKKMRQRKREQENYSRQISIGDGILNLDGADL